MEALLVSHTWCEHGPSFLSWPFDRLCVLEYFNSLGNWWALLVLCLLYCVPAINAYGAAQAVNAYGASFIWNCTAVKVSNTILTLILVGLVIPCHAACSGGRIVSWIIYCWLVWCERKTLFPIENLRSFTSKRTGCNPEMTNLLAVCMVTVIR